MLQHIQALSMTFAIVLAGCATQNQTPQLPVHTATITDARPSTQRVSSPNVVGALVGAGVGGVLGHQVGGGNGKKATTILGALAGAAAGSTVGREDKLQSITYVVFVDDASGETTSATFAGTWRQGTKIHYTKDGTKVTLRDTAATQ